MTDRPRVTVVWTDFGGVLTPPIADAAAAVAAASGISWAVLWTAVQEVAADQGLSGLGPLELGRMTQAEWGARVTARLPHGARSLVDLGSWGDHWYRDRPIETELAAELARIRSSGMPIGMLTNSVREWEPHRARMLAGGPEFDAVVRSHELGVAKPSEEIYRHAEACLPPGDGVPLLIDDVLENCVAARRLGWRAIHHLSTAQSLMALSGELSLNSDHGPSIANESITPGEDLTA
ncbi:HAD family hydrolase [Agromyces badenianii]|uniref:HAD family hydrolase n=1 Tax=Agromyces badenianii TaxID=2080742 RepID=UPI00196B388F|nr:HAD family hydrolase [Agromyces badenianii]